MKNRPLTGRTRFRAGWLKRVILQVEEIKTDALEAEGQFATYRMLRWRDARVQDLGLLTSLAFAQAPTIVNNPPPGWGVELDEPPKAEPSKQGPSRH